jgi:hypothetical protein
MTTHVLGSLPTYLMSFFSLARKYRNAKQEKQGLLSADYCTSCLTKDQSISDRELDFLEDNKLINWRACIAK